MDFSHRRSVLRPLFRTLHGLLGYQRSSALFRPVCLSSACLRFFSPPRPPLVDSLDSKLCTVLDAELLLWLRQHRGRWAVFSAAFHHAERAPRVTSSLTAESPTIRSFPTILGVDTRILATRVRRARKTRK